jgi:3-hydroxyisobutyrate dehydrogenase-like beta-hydroxyacid dehydrogenase
VLEALGKDIFVLGEEAPAANAVKLAGNFLSAATISAIEEAFALVRKSGLAAEEFLRVIESIMASSRYEKYGALTVEERFESMGFTLAMDLKDLKLLLDAAHAAVVPMPVAHEVYSQFLTGVARGQGHLDWIGAARVALENAGLIDKPAR